MQNPKREDVADNAAAVVSGYSELECMLTRCLTFLCSDKGLKHGLQKPVYAVPTYSIIAVVPPPPPPYGYSRESTFRVLV